ncbi:DNA/RNA non-specific endonuclease [Streptococcaceae bacterium ESL0687]|nr:DNA/RNA non-specific endonuclease [Streptococcaceae bacterium ESL0687]
MSKKSPLEKLGNQAVRKVSKKYPILGFILALIIAGFLFYLERSEPNQVKNDIPASSQVQSSVKESSQTSGSSSSTSEIISENSSDFLNLSWDGTVQNIAVAINNNKSTFTSEEMQEDASQDFWVKFSKRDGLTRAGQANARLSRSKYLEVKGIKRPGIPQGNDPAGWKYNGKSNNKKIDFDGQNQMVYNRSHLIAWMLCGDAGSLENLVTGTRAFNSPGMSNYESKISNSLYYQNVHIRYQVTPIYKDNELLPRGVHMMAKSIEDDGKSYDLNIYVFNVQPGVEINYSTGQNNL